MTPASFALRPLWRRCTSRFDALARRERLLIAVAAAAAGLMAADALWLAPALKTWNAARQHAAAAPALRAKADAEAQLDATRAMIRHNQLQAELEQLKARLSDGESAMQAVESDLVGADRMLPLLEQMLARHGELRVREMKTLPRADLGAAAPEPGAAAPANPPPPAAAAIPAIAGAVAAAAPGAPASASDPAIAGAGAAAAPRPSLYRHGIELTVEGSFADLLAYLEALERMPQRLLWGAMRLKVEQHPKAVLTLTVHTLSVDRNWIEL